MSEHVGEERLALYLRGDLPEARSRTVMRHVETCPECRNTLADLSRSLELLAGSFEDPEPDDLAAMRSAVMEKIRTRPRGLGRWTWGLATAAGLTILVLLVRHGERQELPPVAQIPLPAAPAAPAAILRVPPVQAPKIYVARAPRKRREPGVRAARLFTEAGRPAILKMNTSDPNVVILWQLQENEKVATP